MSYIGVDINYGGIASQTAVSAGSTTPIATLDYSVPTSQSILVFLDGVSQVPSVDFNVTSGTTLTFTSSVPSGVVVCVYFLGRSVDIGTPGDGTCTDVKIVDMAASKLTGTVAVANGGTGATTHTANNVLVGNGTSAIASIAPSTSGNVLTSNGSAWTSSAPGGGLTLATEQTPSSGSTVDFTGIPSGTKRITMMIDGISLSGTNDLAVRLGDAGGFETSGYIGKTGNVDSSSGVDGTTNKWLIDAGSAAHAFYGSIVFTLMDSTNFQWTMTYNLARDNGDSVIVGGGSKSLSAELTQIRLRATGSDTFDSGSLNISYE
jgi:hypothetical protein